MIAAAATIAAERCARAQIHAHTEPCDAAIQSWAAAHAVGTDLGWREFLAGAVSSGLVLHVLIAAAANPRTSPADAQAIDDLYLPICALTTLLDGLVDYEQDLQQMGRPGYIRFYENDEALTLAIVNLVRQASTQAPKTQHAGHHLLTLSGILAYYSSAPTANSNAHRKLLRASRKLGVLGTPTHAILTGWRYVERTRPRFAQHQTLPPPMNPDRGTNVSHHEPIDPTHIAIIADGNGRWAQERGLPIAAGHEAGADTLRARLTNAVEFGIKELTVFSFSTENWTRPVSEVHDLLGMLARRIAAEAPGLHSSGVKIQFIGRRERLPAQLRQAMLAAEQLTATNQAMKLYIAVDYGGRDEILQAARQFHDGDEEDFARLLDTAEIQPPQLVIRTGGEHRLSNFLLWHAADADLEFCDEYWPDFDRAALLRSLRAYRIRHTDEVPAIGSEGTQSLAHAVR